MLPDYHEDEPIVQAWIDRIERVPLAQQQGKLPPRRSRRQTALRAQCRVVGTTADALGVERDFKPLVHLFAGAPG
jgi:hypothetical protein